MAPLVVSFIFPLACDDDGFPGGVVPAQVREVLTVLVIAWKCEVLNELKDVNGESVPLTHVG